jgi:hypothetical protein
VRQNPRVHRWLQGRGRGAAQRTKGEEARKLASTAAEGNASERQKGQEGKGPESAGNSRLGRPIPRGIKPSKSQPHGSYPSWTKRQGRTRPGNGSRISGRKKALEVQSSGALLGRNRLSRADKMTREGRLAESIAMHKVGPHGSWQPRTSWSCLPYAGEHKSPGRLVFRLPERTSNRQVD